LHISLDEGASWPIKKEIFGTTDPHSAKNDFTAYSDLIKMGRRKIGILFEQNNYSKINFISMKW
jgi:sialidase-1